MSAVKTLRGLLCLIAPLVLLWGSSLITFKQSAQEDLKLVTMGFLLCSLGLLLFDLSWQYRNKANSYRVKVSMLFLLAVTMGLNMILNYPVVDRISSLVDAIIIYLCVWKVGEITSYD